MRMALFEADLQRPVPRVSSRLDRKHPLKLAVGPESACVGQVWIVQVVRDQQMTAPRLDEIRREDHMRRQRSLNADSGLIGVRDAHVHEPRRARRAEDVPVGIESERIRIAGILNEGLHGRLGLRGGPGDAEWDLIVIAAQAATNRRRAMTCRIDGDAQTWCDISCVRRHAERAVIVPAKVEVDCRACPRLPAVLKKRRVEIVIEMNVRISERLRPSVQRWIRRRSGCIEQGIAGPAGKCERAVDVVQAAGVEADDAHIDPRLQRMLPELVVQEIREAVRKLPSIFGLARGHRRKLAEPELDRSSSGHPGQ